nr:MAG TPA: hypothetical protein [Caudoviricetes sp.]
MRSRFVKNLTINKIGMEIVKFLTIQSLPKLGINVNKKKLKKN